MDKHFDKERFKETVRDNVRNLFRKTLKEATQQQLFQAVAYAVKDVIIDNWMATQQVMDEEAGGITAGYRYTERQLAAAAHHIARLTRLSEGLRAEDAYGLLKIFELRERLLVCRVLIEHMKARRETRWHCFAENLDHPAREARYEKYVNSRLKDGRVEIILRDLVKRGQHYEHTLGN